MRPSSPEVAKRHNATLNADHARYGARFLDSPIDGMDFLDGYEAGVQAVEHHRPVSTRAQGNVPDSWSRGFKKGAEDMRAGNARTGIWECHRPYNEEVRRLRERYPDEYPETDQAEGPVAA